MEKYGTAGQTTDGNGACALLAGYLRLQTRLEHVIIVAFTLQRWLHGRA